MFMLFNYDIMLLFDMGICVTESDTSDERIFVQKAKEVLKSEITKYLCRSHIILEHLLLEKTDIATFASQFLLQSS